MVVVIISKANKKLETIDVITNNSKNALKPILKYRGGKFRELNKYLSYIPHFDRYYEPFFGGGATYFCLRPKNAYVADVNYSLIKFYKSFVKDYQQMKLELTKLQKKYEINRKVFIERKNKNPNNHVIDPNEDLYYEIRDMFNGVDNSDYTYATLYFFINKLAYSGMIRYNDRGMFNVPYGRYANFNTNLIKQAHQKLLASAEIKNESYEKSFELAGNKDFLFLDPPYDTKFSDYGNEMFTGDFNEYSHRKLANDFKNLSAPALMIISKTKLTNELYSGYIQDSYDKSYSVNIRNRFKSQAKHLIITNYKIKN